MEGCEIEEGEKAGVVSQLILRRSAIGAIMNDLDYWVTRLKDALALSEYHFKDVVEELIEHYRFMHSYEEDDD